MNTSLTTFDGFPRDDIDVALVRSTRSRIIVLRNDYKSLMGRIETGLHEWHAEHQAALVDSKTDNSHVVTAGRDLSLVDTPFARVNSVAGGSPAEAATLHPGDLIRRVGDVNWVNHDNLRQVGEFIRKNEGQRVEVVVQRGHDILTLQLQPRTGWGGRGTLGCHLLPL